MTKRDYENISNAIILQAVKDWRQAARMLKKPQAKAQQKRLQLKKKECEIFFLSPWFEDLTDVDGRRLLSVLQKEVGIDE